MVNIWLKVPAIIRAILSGMVIAFIGLLATETLFDLNKQYWASFQWSSFAVILFFILFVQYFRGRWWPQATKTIRSEAMTWNPLSANQWKWAGLCTLATFVFVPASAAFSFRFIELPPDALDRSAEIVGMSLPAACLYIMALSVSAGVWEEVAFRGYLQNIIAKRHHIYFAIGLSSVLFWLAHFNHSSGPARILVLLVGAIMLASLAYASNSIIPGVIGHIASDIYTGLHTRKIIDPSYLIKRQSVLETGLDLHFILWTVAMLASILLFIPCLRHLHRATHGSTVS